MVEIVVIVASSAVTLQYGSALGFDLTYSVDLRDIDSADCRWSRYG